MRPLSEGEEMIKIVLFSFPFGHSSLYIVNIAIAYPLFNIYGRTLSISI